MTAWFAGCLVRPVLAEEGILRWSGIYDSIRKATPHTAPTGLISIENTHNMAGGFAYPMETIHEICDNAHAMGIRVHMDGARIFNAACATGRPVSEIADKADTVMFCLSKGLGAPVGSMVVGGEEIIEEARLYRKRLGGGMRQAGVLAAAGLIAIEEMPKRLGEDHANARFLATELAKLPGIRLDPAKVQTNIVVFDISATGFETSEFIPLLRRHGVRMSYANARDMRAVTHYDVSRADCERAVEAVAQALGVAQTSKASH